MANDVYITVGEGLKCSWNTLLDKHWSRLQLFPATGPLELVKIETLGQIQKMEIAN